MVGYFHHLVTWQRKTEHLPTTPERYLSKNKFTKKMEENNKLLFLDDMTIKNENGMDAGIATDTNRYLNATPSLATICWPNTITRSQSCSIYTVWHIITLYYIKWQSNSNSFTFTHAQTLFLLSSVRKSLW